MPVFASFGNIIFFQYINQFRERRCNINAFLILYAANTLIQHFFYDKRKVVSRLSLRHFINVHENRYKWRLSVSCHQRNDLILYHLYTAVDFLAHTHFRDFINLLVSQGKLHSVHLFANLFPKLQPTNLNKRRKMRQRYALSAILRTRNLRDALCCNIAGSRKTFRRVNHRFADDRSVLQHIFQIDKTAIVHMLRKVIRIMKMDNSLLVRIYNIFRQQKPFCDILAYLACHIISLHAVHGWIFIGIFLFYLFIIALKKR